ncbi:YqiA/YcfP family alpha/beta fold hydrolase [Alteromonas sp. CI.11.F.A3]|uniref:alpha/beta hydrolase n=1 Tax=Alteromonas sp. CI.11.F.A3 TaxID=3079555 RepID=UPI002943636D|nr:YqiA/YcfP family alpha/beta fold hydrolase [Alteromonas sp. CI.11.F.A3]WOI37393.1 YqiA/YcfP family alpha/beta fold hydrolase [Alteromonas sp. CI.11.F.A3]
MTTVIFSHGKESGPWGSKITTLSNVASDVGFNVISVDYQDLPSPEDRITRLVDTVQEQGDEVILVGSSMGGYVSLVAAERVSARGLFLLAPALYMPNYEVQEYNYTGKTSVIHGWNDDVIPVAHSIDYAKLRNSQLLLLEDGHRLSNSMFAISPFFRNWLHPFTLN